MKKKLLLVFNALLLLCMMFHVSLVKAQSQGRIIINLLSQPTTGINTTAKYEIFTSAGAITNAGKTVITGTVGSGAGAISGFSATTTMDAANTAKATADLIKIVNALNATIAKPTAEPLELGGLTLTHTSTLLDTVNIFTITGAASITTGTLTLVGKATDIFIIKVSGAFGTAAATSVTLVGVQPNNVIWQVQGAVAFGAGTTMNGNVIGAAAIAVGAGCTINGRLFTTAGAIALSGSQAINPTYPVPPPPVPYVPSLGTNLATFNIYTASGAVANAGKSQLYDTTGVLYAGNVGTNAGAISGFATSVTTASANGTTTVAAASEVATLFTNLSNATPTNTTPMALEMAGLTLKGGVYAIPGAASITGTLILTGSATDIFIIQVTGAMATAAGAKVILAGGALAKNVYWQVGGAVAFGANTTLVGNIVGGAAVAIGAGSSINGNIYSIAGAISLGSSTVFNTAGIPAMPPYIPSIGSPLSTFNIYTASGAVANAGKSQLYDTTGVLYAGNVGTNAGAISGFATAVTSASATPATLLAATQVVTLFNNLSNATPTNTTPMALEMAGLTLTAGVYAIPGAASITGTLTLSGSATDIFIIQVPGAMATAAGAKVVLTGGALAQNVYWQVGGAVAFGANTTLVGNIVGGAAVAIGAGSSINGNIYSIGGAIALGNAIVFNTAGIPPTPPYIPTMGVNLSTFNIYTASGAVANAGKSQLYDTTGVLYAGNVGTNAGAISGFATSVTTASANGTTTVAAASEVATLFTNLSNATPTNTTPMALEMAGLTLTAGVYAIPGAASITGTLTLSGSATDIFIIQVTGAMATAAGAKVVLAGGALAQNVYWQVGGAVAFGANTTLVGNIVGGAAVAIGAGSSINGNIYSIGGAIALGNAIVFNTLGIPATPPYVPAPGSNLSTFNVYTASGAITNAGKSKVYLNSTNSGNVGTNAGAISGFATSVSTESADATTLLASSEVSGLFNSLGNAMPTNTTPMALEMAGLTLTAGVYAIPGAASVTGTLTLSGSATDVFIIQVTGALATAAGAKVVLAGAALAKNIYWHVNGAVALGANTTLAGNIVGGAAIAVGAGSTINGNIYTIGGAIALGSSTVFNAGMPPFVAYSPSIGINLAQFQVYTAAGAITDAGVSTFQGTVTAVQTVQAVQPAHAVTSAVVAAPPTITGMVGSGAGAITGIPAAQILVNAAANTEVATLFAALGNATPTNIIPMALELAGQTLTAGVYAIPGAASLTGTLTLSGSASDIFIIQVNGAMAAAAASNVVLTNGALAKNVYWQIGAALALGANTNFVGTAVAGAAIAVGAGCTIQGNIYTTAGAIAISGTAFSSRSILSFTGIAGFVSDAETLSMYPNPNHGKINLVYNGDKTQVVSTQVYDANMHLVYTAAGFKASIDLPSAQAGLNFIYLTLKTKTLVHKFIVLKN